ncbi:hypothetical protein D4764_15G0007600 [Takifugu flavidus]|uniref:Uncharacterized protein n=1 Tax=Takifugu flavidus TaxID=433684 RepID=A0A5C6P2R5_9TELE|nr:hypothetical protein D4764_15G0007600 [Takifugu flavidus]
MQKNKFNELRTQFTKDTHVMQEQLGRYKKQLQVDEKMIKDKNLPILKEQIKVKKHEQTITHMKQLLAKKDLDTRDDLLKEIEKEKKAAQEVEDRAAV